MTLSRLRVLLLATVFAIPALAHAHPGHDGDHDFVWDFGHLVNNPLATIACVALLVAAGWGVGRLRQSAKVKKSPRAQRD